MLIDSVVIRLTRVGAGIGPNYILTIYGNGSVIFDGKENVGTVGKEEGTIANEDVLSLLNEFKKSNFFTLKSSYISDELGDKPHTIMSISIPKDSGEMATKNVTYNHGDENTPEELKNLETKIKQTSGAEKWIKVTAKTESIKKDNLEKPDLISENKRITPSKKPEKQKSKKVIVIGAIAVIIVVLLLLMMFTGIIDFSNDDSSTGSKQNPTIDFLTTASYVTSNGEYYLREEFEQGETVFIYLEYSNVTIENDTDCNLNFEVKASLDGDTYYEEDYIDTTVDDFYRIMIDIGLDWPAGEYLLSVKITDVLSDKSSTFNTNFNVTGIPLKITELATASQISGLGNYNLKTEFSQGDKIWVYEEYQGFNTYSDGSCNLTLELIIQEVTGDKTYTDSWEETNGAYVGHQWWFTTDETWPAEPSYYELETTITDNISGETYSESTFFSLE